jgi:hypothetical protein
MREFAFLSKQGSSALVPLGEGGFRGIDFRQEIFLMGQTETSPFALSHFTCIFASHFKKKLIHV